MRRSIAFLIFPGFQLLDAAGPISAFEIADAHAPGTYGLRVIAPTAGRVPSSAGVVLDAGAPRSRGIDTLVVAGGDGTREALADERLLRFLRRAAPRVRRMTSVCSGSLLLAKAGLLDGRRATTHWSRAADMKRHFPAVRVEPDSIWVRDGHFWTSAGITAGIDLALALIADDLGAGVARAVARQLVVYVRRPGGQTQHSRLLELEAPDERFLDLHAWARQRLDTTLTVDVLAARMKMSPRSFARAYVETTGITPAKAVELLRLEAARALLESGERSLADIAERTGFGNIDRMRRSFLRRFGAPPSVLRRTSAGPPRQ